MGRKALFNKKCSAFAAFRNEIDTFILMRELKIIFAKCYKAKLAIGGIAVKLKRELSQCENQAKTQPLFYYYFSFLYISLKYL